MSQQELVDVEAERAVLGAVLVERRLSDAARGLTPEDFGHAQHAAIWRAMVALHAGGIPVDHLTLAERLRAAGTLAQAGGPAYLMVLDTPMATHAAAHVATVKDRALRRGLLERARALAQEARNLRTAPAGTAYRAGQDFRQLAAVGAGDADEMGSVDVLEVAQKWEDFYAGAPPPQLSAGLPVLEEAGFKGFLPNLNLVGGKASMGKTAFVASVVWGWLKEGKTGGIFGLEDGTSWLVKRHVSRHLGIPLGDVGACRLHDYQQDRYADFMGRAADMLGRLLFVHRTSGLEAPELLRKAERWIARGARWLVIDHGGRIGHTSADSKERYDLGIKRTVEALDNLAHNTGVPILVNWHYNRAGAVGKPTMEAFKESGYLEAFSGTMLGLWERPEQNPDCLLVTVLKNREGPRDVTVAIPRDAKHGLVRMEGGYVLDLRAEADAERAQQQAARPRRTRLFEAGEVTP